MNQTISVAPLQVHYYSEALPTHRGYCVEVSRRSATGIAVENLAQGPYVAARAEFEPTTFRTKGDESTDEPPRTSARKRYQFVARLSFMDPDSLSDN